MNIDTKVPNRESEMRKVLSILSIATENCEKSFEEFKVRLSSVCNKCEETRGATPEQEYSTILAQEINKIISRLETLNGQMIYLRNRIEL